MSQEFETIIIGGGQAGLATSYHLAWLGREHIVLEQAAHAGNVWHNDRWDSFAFLTPNWTFRLPGAEYSGSDPDGFLPRDEIVMAFEQYVEHFNLPVLYRVRATEVIPHPSGAGFQVSTKVNTTGDQEVFNAHNVVVATGLFQHPRHPASSNDLPTQITHLHSGQYRNPASLPPGAVLVVGSAQSGCQIAEELYKNGRQVYLCTSSAGRAPRRYRGKDIFEWQHLSGFLDQTVDELSSLTGKTATNHTNHTNPKFAANPHLSGRSGIAGRNGGSSINLHQFARDGVVLLGHLQGISQDRVYLAPDLKENLAKADLFEAELVKMVDGYIAKNGLNAPSESLPQLRDGYAAEEIDSLSLSSAGITTIIWAVGYRFDYSLVKMPVFDGDGYPIQRRGATHFPGLFFVGLPWLYKRKSGLLMGVGEDAEYIANVIAARGSKS